MLMTMWKTKKPTMTNYTIMLVPVVMAMRIPGINNMIAASTTVSMMTKNIITNKYNLYQQSMIIALKMRGLLQPCAVVLKRDPQSEGLTHRFDCFGGSGFGSLLEASGSA